MYGLVNYRPIDGIGPSFDIILRPWSDFGADMSQRRHWNIEGRIVVDDNGGLGGCLPDACTIGIQWDSQTNLTLEWANYNGQPLPKERTIESLLPFVSLLVEDATPYTSGPLLPVG